MRWTSSAFISSGPRLAAPSRGPSPHAVPGIGWPEPRGHGCYVRTRLYAKQRSFETLIEKDLIAFGSPEDIIRVARRYQEAGLTHFLAIANFGGLDHGKVLRSMELMAKEVLPAFQLGVGAAESLKPQFDPSLVSIEESLEVYRQLPHSEFQVLPSTPHPLNKMTLSRLVAALYDFFGGPC